MIANTCYPKVIKKRSQEYATGVVNVDKKEQLVIVRARWLQYVESTYPILTNLSKHIGVNIADSIVASADGIDAIDSIVIMPASFSASSEFKESMSAELFGEGFQVEWRL